MAARLLDKFKRVLPFALLVIYMAQWAAFINVVGGLDAFVRITDFMPTITAAEIINQGDGFSLYDLAVQHEAQERVIYPYKSLGEKELLPYNHLPFEALLVAWLMRVPTIGSYVGVTL